MGILSNGFSSTFLLSRLFGLFTSCMIIDQWDVVMTNMTHIDRLKGEIFCQQPASANRKPPLKGVHEVFGARSNRREGFRLDWLAPFVRVTFPASVKDEIMGFCIPCGSNRGDLEMRSLKGSRTAVNEIV